MDDHRHPEHLAHRADLVRFFASLATQQQQHHLHQHKPVFSTLANDLLRLLLLLPQRQRRRRQGPHALLSAYQLAELYLDGHLTHNPTARAVLWYALRALSRDNGVHRDGEHRAITADPFLPLYLIAVERASAKQRRDVTTREASEADGKGTREEEAGGPDGENDKTTGPVNGEAAVAAERCEAVILCAILNGKEDSIAALDDEGWENADPNLLENEDLHARLDHLRDSCAGQFRRFGLTPAPKTSLLAPDVKLDDQEQPPDARKAALPELFTKLLTTALSLTEQEAVVSVVRTDPSFALWITPSDLPTLVSLNTAVAVEFVQQIAVMDGDYSEYITVIVNMDPSIPSMEFVYGLVASGALQPDTLNEYIVHCIDVCERTSERFAQNRQVVLVCMFLQSLLRNDMLLHLDGIFIPMQSFCLQFSKIREAAALFRMISSFNSSSA